MMGLGYRRWFDYQYFVGPNSSSQQKRGWCFSELWVLKILEPKGQWSHSLIWHLALLKSYMMYWIIYILYTVSYFCKTVTSKLSTLKIQHLFGSVYTGLLGFWSCMGLPHASVVWSGVRGVHDSTWSRFFQVFGWWQRAAWYATALSTCLSLFSD